MICHRCRNLVLWIEDEKRLRALGHAQGKIPRNDASKTLEDYELALREGCEICAMLEKRLKSDPSYSRNVELVKISYMGRSTGMEEADGPYGWINIIPSFNSRHLADIWMLMPIEPSYGKTSLVPRYHLGYSLTLRRSLPNTGLRSYNSNR
jgi:hypothetical protein